MLKCKIKRSGYLRVRAKGTPHDLMVEAAALIQNIYRNINKQAPDAAQAFKNALLGTLLDPESPVWKEDN